MRAGRRSATYDHVRAAGSAERAAGSEDEEGADRGSAPVLGSHAILDGLFSSNSQAPRRGVALSSRPNLMVALGGESTPPGIPLASSLRRPSFSMSPTMGRGGEPVEPGSMGVLTRTPGGGGWNSGGTAVWNVKSALGRSCPHSAAAGSQVCGRIWVGSRIPEHGWAYCAGRNRGKESLTE